MDALEAFRAWTSGNPKGHDYPGPGLLKSSIDRAIEALDERVRMGLAAQNLKPVSKVIHNKREIGNVMEDSFGRMWFVTDKRRLSFGAMLAALRRYFELTKDD